MHPEVALDLVRDTRLAVPDGHGGQLVLRLHQASPWPDPAETYAYWTSYSWDHFR
jgi:hypothetical protein